MLYNKTRSSWSDEDWAARGYVLVNIRERGGIIDPVYVKREFTSPVITSHEWESLKSAAKRRHKENVCQRNADYNKQRQINERAMKPYREYAEQVRSERRKADIESGRIPLDEMTFFDLL